MLDLDQLQSGDRIVVRYRLAADLDSSSPELSDALGELQQVTAQSVSIATRRGVIVVPRKDITHAKRVPPPPARHPSTR